MKWAAFVLVTVVTVALCVGFSTKPNDDSRRLYGRGVAVAGKWYYLEVWENGSLELTVTPRSQWGRGTDR